jgi:hypothetical protein
VYRYTYGLNTYNSRFEFLASIKAMQADHSNKARLILRIKIMEFGGRQADTSPEVELMGGTT